MHNEGGKPRDRPEDLLGDAGLMKELKIKLMVRILGAELTAHLGYEEGKELPARLPKPKPKIIKINPADSRYERGTDRGAGQIVSLSADQGSHLARAAVGEQSALL